MAEWLMVQLARSADERCAWMPADAAGRPLQPAQSGTLAEAARQAPGRRIAVLVPSGDVLLTDVELPPRSGVRPAQVVPFALEEQLAADIETLHFAVAARADPGVRTPVAVVARGLMQQWLDALSQAGLTPDTLCASAALLPDNPGHTVVWLDGDMLCVRRSGRSAVTVPADGVLDALQAALGADLSAEHFIVYVTPQDWQRRSGEIEGLRPHCASLKAQLLNSGPLPMLSPQLNSGRVVNLRSGDFAPRQVPGAGFARWRVAAMLAGALIAVHVGGLSLQLLQVHRGEQTLDQQIGEIARRALPGDSGGGDVRGRIERRLLAQQDQAGGTGLLGALDALAQALGSVNGAALKSLSYHDGALDLSLRASDAESLEHIDEALRSSGWQAELTSGAAAAGAYEGHIQMHAGAAPRRQEAR